MNKYVQYRGGEIIITATKAELERAAELHDLTLEQYLVAVLGAIIHARHQAE